MENVITNINFHVNRLRKSFILKKEQRRYFDTFSTDYNYLKMKENFDIVLNNIEKLKEIFGFKNVSQITSFIAYLIHNGFLSIKKEYHYKKVKDIIGFIDEENLLYALKIFSGFGCCRHTACLGKIMLDKFNISNKLSIVEIDGKFSHSINYLKDSEDGWFVDLTSNNFLLFHGDNEYIYPFYQEKETGNNNYRYHFYKDNSQEENLLSLEKQKEIINIMLTAVEVFNKNYAVFMEFYFQNLPYYKEINSAYQEIYEKEKRLELIKE